MKTMLDMEKLIGIIDARPEITPFLNNKSEAFKHLYEELYLVLLKHNSEEVNTKINIDVGIYDFDDLIEFDDFLTIKGNSFIKSPIRMIDKIYKDLTPISKPSKFI